MKTTVTQTRELTADEVRDIIRAHLKLPHAKVTFSVALTYHHPPEMGDEGRYAMTQAIIESTVEEDQQPPLTDTFKAALQQDECPKCGGKIVSRCRCPRSDSTCENGHTWHYCYDNGGAIHAGHSDHGIGKPCCPAGAKDL